MSGIKIFSTNIPCPLHPPCFTRVDMVCRPSVCVCDCSDASCSRPFLSHVWKELTQPCVQDFTTKMKMFLELNLHQVFLSAWEEQDNLVFWPLLIMWTKICMYVRLQVGGGLIVVLIVVSHGESVTYGKYKSKQLQSFM